ncbi:hypothetical protein JHK84_034370 [Glycine max]|nr:hypothetical protein JHK85_034743 [Glycine max]KAG4986413.1 hypothetical protein JHK86_034104 [Glycine max]KAG5140602.1 hypothetical protein JHK84_034370 [Glycine max]
MSHSRKPVSSELGFTERFRDSLSCSDDNTNKPDFRELDLGSPVSTLRPRHYHSAPTTTSSTSTSTSSGSTGSGSGRSGNNNAVSKRSHSGELSGSSETNSPTRVSKPGHRRSNSGQSQRSPSSSSSSAAVNSPPLSVLPAGNICPSGRVLKAATAAVAPSRSSRSDVLGSGTGNYGHGSIMRGGKGGGGGDVRIAGDSAKRVDPEEVKRMGNAEYKRGHFAEALCLYDRAIAMSPGNAAYRSNRAAALTGLGRLPEAVRACEEAVVLDPNYGRAHQRLAMLFLSVKVFATVILGAMSTFLGLHLLGQVEDSRKRLCYPGLQPDPAELQKLQIVEKHINKCGDVRRIRDWKSVLREVDAAVAAGADSCVQLFMCRAEALLKQHQMDDAESCLSQIPKSEPRPGSLSQARFFGMFSEAYCFFVRAQIEMAFGRFENAVTAAEKASQIDPRNVEVAVLLNNVRMVARARLRGNDLFKSERFTEACSAYGEGLRLDPSNSVLYCNRAACWFKLGQWERSIEDCNQALCILPNYTKAILRRAASNSKLERWEEAVTDYELLRRELPDDNEVAENLFHAQVALKKSRGEEVHNLKFGGEVEDISGLEQFRAAISLPGVSVVLFETASNMQCKQISPFMNTLCSRHPSINFLKVDIQTSPAVAAAENVRVVPTFKIYKNGSRVKEIICPSHDMLEHSIRHYSL